jgi:hypothetical protein
MFSSSADRFHDVFNTGKRACAQHSVNKVISVCFPRPPNATDVPWARMTCCVGRHICTTFWSSSQLRPGNKTAVFGIEDTIFSATEKSVPSSQQHQVNADLFFFFFFDIRGIVHKESDCQWEILLQGFETTEGKCEAQTA